MFLLIQAHPGSPGQRPLNICVCVCALKSQNSFLIIVTSLTYAQVLLNDLIHFSVLCLQCFDAVGWAAGRASGL